MKYRNPVLPEQIEPTRSSRLHIENLYAILCQLVNIESPACKGKLLGIMGMIYNRMLFLYAMSAPEFIKEIKLVRRWLIELFRDGDISNPGLEISRWDSELSCPVLVEGILDIYSQIKSDNDAETLLFFQRVMYSLFLIDRVVVLPNSPSYTSITSKPVSDYCKHDLYPTRENIIAALSALGISKAEFKRRYALYCKNFQYEILASKGPNGPQTWSAHVDSRAWVRADALLPKLRNFLEESKLGRILTDLIGCVRVDFKEILPNAQPRLGKLALINEWGGKTRIVAELDYWSQMALTPLHHTINSFLKELIQDGTFDQGKVADQVKAWTGDPLAQPYSFDLTTATDRLPAHLQEMILAELLPSEGLASNWRSLMTDRGFLTPEGNIISYKVGQPMGARSSFPMLALTHHVIIQIAAQRAKLEGYKDYVVLGDDSTMCGESVASHYQALMAVLEVPINLSKSILWSSESLPAAEICKRVYIDGKELSVFPSPQMVKTIKDGSLAPTLQNDLLTKGWNPSAPQFWLFMSTLLDKESLITLMKLNIAPISITGLVRQIKPPTKLVDLRTWFDEVSLVERDLVELHTFVIASDQLKRLDTVLRASSSLTDALGILAAHEASPNTIPEHVRNLWLTEVLDEKKLAAMNKFLSEIGPITYNHPILSAARAETNRISELLHSLNSYDTKMVLSARKGLLEACRSAVGSVWTWGEQTPVQEMRAVFVRTLTVLNQIVNRARDSDAKVKTYSINYSVTLTSLGRLWNVHFAIGSQTTVNALRASISRNVIEASQNLDNALSDLVFDSRASRGPKPTKTTISSSNQMNSRVSDS